MKQISVPIQYLIAAALEVTDVNHSTLALPWNE